MFTDVADRNVTLVLCQSEPSDPNQGHVANSLLTPNSGAISGFDSALEVLDQLWTSLYISGLLVSEVKQAREWLAGNRETKICFEPEMRNLADSYLAYNSQCHLCHARNFTGDTPANHR